MKWLLIVYIFSGSNSVGTQQVGPFKNKILCEQARTSIQTEFHKLPSSFHVKKNKEPYASVCVQLQSSLY